MTGGELRNKIDEFLFLLTKQLLHTRRRDEEGIGELVMESNLQNACIRHSSRHSLDSKIYSFRKSKKNAISNSCWRRRSEWNNDSEQDFLMNFQCFLICLCALHYGVNTEVIIILN